MPSKRITDFFKGTERSASVENPEVLDSGIDADQPQSMNDDQPNTDEGEPCIKKSRYEAKFQQLWLTQYNWLRYDEETGMTCHLCRKSGKTNPLTSGCKNYRTSTLKRHLDSREHIQSVKDSFHQHEFTIVESHVHKKLLSREKSLICAMRTAYYIAKTNISIRNFTSLLKLQEENGSEISDLKVGENATYTSRTTAEEFIETFSEIIGLKIETELSNSEFVSLLCDESTDISVQKKLVIYGKIVDDDLNSKTFFLGNLKLSDVSVTAEVLFNALKEFLNSKNVMLPKIVGFGSDGASIMTGKKTGVATRFKQSSPHCISVHCMAHTCRLNLCSSRAADEVDYLKNTFQKTLTDIYYYFSKSTARTAELKEMQTVLNSPIIKMKEVHEIRWLSFYNSISAVFNSLKALMKYFKEHKSDSTRTANIYNIISDYAFVATLYFLMDIIPSLAALNMVFQKRELDISSIKPAIDGFYAAVKMAKSGKIYYQLLLKNEHFKVVNNTGTVCGVFLSNNKDNTVKCAIRKFEKCREDFTSKLVEQINRRFPSENTSVAMSLQILGLRSLSFLSQEEVTVYGLKDLDILIKHYGYEQKCAETSITSKPFIDPDQTKVEWNLIKPLVLEQRYPRDHTPTLWKLILRNHKDSFPNLLKLAKLSLHMPLQTADCERGFSCQNNIHTSSRNRLDAKTVNQLMLIQMEGPSSSDFDFGRAVQIWKGKKERRLFQYHGTAGTSA